MDTLLAIYAAVILNGGIDYVGYNIAKRDPAMLAVYRVTHGLSIAGTTGLLTYKYDAKAGGKFLLNQWGFVNDLAYYGWAWVLNPSRASGFENRSDVRRIFRKPRIDHAWWTPAGLMGFTETGTVVMQSINIFTITIAF